MAREPLVSRTDEKLEYARRMLDELKSLDPAGSRSALARAHEEAVLYHAVGAVDAFLQEVNDAYGLGLPMDKVRLGRFKKLLPTGTSPAVDAIRRLRRRPRTRPWKWLEVATDLRNNGTHRARPPVIYLESSGHGRVAYRNPNPRAKPKELRQDMHDFLDFVVTETDLLIRRLRTTLPK